MAVKQPLLDDHAPYIFRTHDFGRTWTKIVTGIAADDYVHAVREDPTRKGLLYAGTEHGVYISYDDGDHWQSLSLNLPDSPVSDIWVEANDLRRDARPRLLHPRRHRAAAAVRDARRSPSDAQLFKPADAIRSVGPVTIDYWLKKPAQNLTLDILDARAPSSARYKGACRTRSCRMPAARCSAAAAMRRQSG